MCVIELLQRCSRAGENGRTRGDTFQAIAVKRTHTGEPQVHGMASRGDMTDLRMHETVNRRAAHYHATADACADGEIHQIIDVSRRAPPVLSQSRGVDVGIES